MPELHFGARTKKRYIQDRAGSTNPQQCDTMDINNQDYLQKGHDKKTASVKTIQLSFNEGCEVTDSLFESLLPKIADWTKLPIEDTPIDAAFHKDLLAHLDTIHNSKKTKLFLKGTPGIGPQFGFTAQLKPGTPLQQAIDDKITKLTLLKDRTKYRLIDNGIAIYFGPKGDSKKTQRSQLNTIFTMNDMNRNVFARELNIMFKFSLAIQDTDTTADIPLRYFFNDIKPYALIDIAINMHVTKASDQASASFHSVSDIMSQVEIQLDEFNAFIQRNLALPNMTNPSKIQPSTQWKPMAGCDRYNPTLELYKSRNIDTPHTNATQRCENLPKTTRTKPLNPPQPPPQQPKGSFSTDRLAHSNSSDEEPSSLAPTNKKQLKKNKKKLKKQGTPMQPSLFHSNHSPEKDGMPGPQRNFK